ncbi:MAG: hypothetical protein V1667_01520 [bacterium]
MAKNLDGIKKLNPDEINENRRIVLKYIGEKDYETAKDGNRDARVFPVSSLVDGIKMKENKNFNPEKKIVPDKAALEQAAKKQAEAKAKAEFEEKALIEQEKKRREKSELKASRRLEKIKRAEERKIIKREIKSAKAEAAKKRKIKREKAVKIFKKKLKNKVKLFFAFFKRIFADMIIYSAVVFVIFYFIFCVMVLRFKFEGSIAMKIERFLPVPAAISTCGIINFHDFLGIRNSDYNNLSISGKKEALGQWIVLKKLRAKYGLPSDSPEEILLSAFAADEDFNQEGMSRIKKISELLKNEDDIKQMDKYADECGEAVYSAENAEKKFGKKIFDLKLSQTSDMIIAGDGYYIARIFYDQGGELGVKYVFVKAKTAVQYASEEVAKMKIFILAN